MVLALAQPHVAPDPRPRLAGDDEPFPLRRRRAALARDDLHLITVLQLDPQLYHAAVDLGPDAAVADLRVHGVGEIDRRSTAGQGDEVALGREAEHLVLEHLQLGVLKKVLWVRSMLQDFQQLADPAVLLAFRDTGHLLVGPMRGNTQLRDLVHISGADLNLDLAPLGADDGGVQGTVAVRLRRADVVFEPPGQHVVGAVNDAQGRVAGRQVADMDAERHDVRQLFEADVLALHLAPDGVGSLLATEDVGLDAGRAQHLRQLSNHPIHEVHVALPQMAQPVQYTLARIGAQLGERQVLKFRLERLHADPLGQGRVDLHRLGGDPPALVRAFYEVQGSHVV